MIVRVEPLRHLQCRDALPAENAASRHRKVTIEWVDRARTLVALRDGAHEHGRVQDVIVEREVSRRDVVDPEFGMQPPRMLSNLGRRGLKVTGR